MQAPGRRITGNAHSAEVAMKAQLSPSHHQEWEAGILVWLREHLRPTGGAGKDKWSHSPWELPNREAPGGMLRATPVSLSPPAGH